MKKLAIVALALMALGAVAAPAAAQGEGAALGDVYLSSAQDSYVNEVEATPFVNFNFYLVIEIDYADIGLPDQQAANGIKAWECGVTMPAQITVLSRTILPETSLNLGSDDNWIVGTGQNVRANTTPFAVIAYTGLLLAEQTNLHVTLAAPDPSSFDPAAPGWNEFNDSGECTLPGGGGTPCVRQFAQTNVGEGDFWVNRIIAIEDESFGSLKSRF